MKNVKSIVALVAVLVIAIGGYVFPKVTAVQSVKDVGAVVGPDTYFSYVANNNVQKYAIKKGFTSATTTVCAVKSPAATSTLSLAAVNFFVSSSTASTVTLAIAATPYATTTVLNIVSFAANAQGVAIASSTPVLATGAPNSLVVSPNQFFVVGMAGGIGTFSPAGSCTAEFIVI